MTRAEGMAQLPLLSLYKLQSICWHRDIGQIRSRELIECHPNTNVNHMMCRVRTAYLGFHCMCNLVDTRSAFYFGHGNTGLGPQFWIKACWKTLLRLMWDGDGVPIAHGTSRIFWQEVLFLVFHFAITQAHTGHRFFEFSHRFFSHPRIFDKLIPSFQFLSLSLFYFRMDNHATVNRNSPSDQHQESFVCESFFVTSVIRLAM